MQAAGKIKAFSIAQPDVGCRGWKKLLRDASAAKQAQSANETATSED